MCAEHSVWWSDISKQLVEAICSCTECVGDASSRKEPTLLPMYPWQMVGSDLFVLKGNTYVLIVDYFF